MLEPSENSSVNIKPDIAISQYTNRRKKCRVYSAIGLSTHVDTVGSLKIIRYRCRVQLIAQSILSSFQEPKAVPRFVLSTFSPLAAATSPSNQS